MKSEISTRVWNLDGISIRIDQKVPVVGRRRRPWSGSRPIKAVRARRKPAPYLSNAYTCVFLVRHFEAKTTDSARNSGSLDLSIAASSASLISDAGDAASHRLDHSSQMPSSTCEEVREVSRKKKKARGVVALRIQDSHNNKNGALCVRVRPAGGVFVRVVGRT